MNERKKKKILEVRLTKEGNQLRDGFSYAELQESFFLAYLKKEDVVVLLYNIGK